MNKVGSLLNWIGGGITKVAASGLVSGGIFLVTGMTPPEIFIWVFTDPPGWLLGGWTRLILLIVGMAVILVSLNFNRWSLRQKAIDSLAEDLSWAISDLLNRKPEFPIENHISRWEADYRAWYDRVSKKLENRAFFTRADQLHFDRIGFVDQIKMSGDDHWDKLLSQLKLKFERLRDIINWSQQRKR